MLSGLDARGVAIAAAAQARVIARGVDLIGQTLPGIAAAAGDDAIILSGSGIERQLIDDAELRWIGSLLR